MANQNRWKGVIFLIVVLGCTLWAPNGLAANPDRPLVLASSTYVGWIPWFLAAEDGTLTKHANARNLNISFVSGDYLETIHQFVEGKVDAVTATNIDAMAFLIGNAVAADVILISSFSHGNDAILLRLDAIDDITVGPIGLVEYSVSHYLLDRYLQRNRIPYDQVTRKNLKETELVQAFGDPNSELIGVVTWNPLVCKIESWLNVSHIFDSRSIDGEIADMLVVRRETLKAHPEFGQALLATWFEMAIQLRGPKRFETVAKLARLSNCSPQSYESQLATTLLIKTPQVAQGYLLDPLTKSTLITVQHFVERHAFVAKPPPMPWFSFPGEKPALLHVNDRPLTTFMKRQ
jgi:NitT/TauT family transport system substrate-binding protein